MEGLLIDDFVTKLIDFKDQFALVFVFARNGSQRKPLNSVEPNFPSCFGVHIFREHQQQRTPIITNYYTLYSINNHPFGPP